MTSFVIAGHGQFPEGIANTAKFISGMESGLNICSLTSEENPDAYKDKLKSVINQVTEKDQIIVFCDLVGGTPFKAAIQIKSEEAKQRIKIITGINLPGLLTAVMLKDTLDLDSLLEEVTKEASTGVQLF